MATRTKQVTSDPGSHVTLIAPEGETFRSLLVQNDSGSALYVKIGQGPGTAGAIYRIPSKRLRSVPLPDAEAVTVTVDPAGVPATADDFISVTASDREIGATDAATP